LYEKTEIPLKQIQLTKGGRRIMKPKAIIYGERPHRELSIHEVPLWSFNDKDNVHEIENQKQMVEEIVIRRGSLNNHLIYLQGDYPGIINDASKIEPAAKVSRISYNEDTKTFIADITSTNQQFIEMIAATEYFPRVHPCYEAETNHQSSEESTRISSTFKRLLCWLVEPIKNMTKISIEYRPEGRSDESKNGNNDKINNSSCNRRRDEMPLPKDDVYNAILKNIRPVLDDPFSDDGKRKWTYESCADSFNWQIHTPKAILQIGASLVFDIENKCWVWEICTHDTSNVNVKVYANRVVLRDESCSNYDDFSVDFMRKIRDDFAERLDEYNREYWSKSKSDADNEKANRWETMRTAINTTLNSFCDKIISSSIVGGSYEKLGSLRRITLGEKTIDVILQFDTDYDSWVIFIGDATKPRILISTNGDITADISAFIPDPLCFKDIQTLCDMLATCRNKNWQVKEDTREERIKSCEASDNKDLPAFSQSLIKDGKRPSKVDYYLAMAEVASTRGTCLRRRFGSVIVKDDRIVSTGYVGAPSGRQNCCDIGYCRREKLNAPRGTMYHLCRSIHSEQNAIINASKEEMKGATLYLTGVNIADGSIVKNADCCSMCKRFIINSGISRVIIKDPEKPEGYRAIDVSEWVSNDDSLDVEVGY
jgi:Deoxycytidylate deaminase